MTTPAPPFQRIPSRGRRSSRPSGDDRELAILKTAERLFEERTLAEISVDDLAKGAGISRPTFYFYFTSKQAVLLSLLDRVLEQVQSAIDGIPQLMLADPVAGWRLAITAFFESFRPHRWVARAGASALTSDNEVRQIWLTLMQTWIDQTAALITAERKRGAAPDAIPAADLAISLNLMNERAMLSSLAAEQPAVEHDRVVDTLTHIWLTAIYGSVPR
jgi:TetR/AcrR family transcriptional regulator, ethionamide resistance regulator